MSWISDTVSFAERNIDRSRLNGALSGAKNTTMRSLIGEPCARYSDQCAMPTNPHVSALMATQDVGPFRATGMKLALAALREIFAEVKAEHPEIHAALGSAGMLCCRYVRGSQSAVSNHSWGAAIDVTLEGKLDKRGDGRTQRGLLTIAPIFNRHKFFWGAAFPTEDAMHFEASDQLIRDWAAAGAFGAGAKTVIAAQEPAQLSFGDRGMDVEELQRGLALALAMDIAIDGIFGRDTRAAVLELQRREGLKMDGIAGPKTLAALGARSVTLAAAE
ncbi:peptidoglycan-binding protein [Frigidibacter sp. MR17.14]|uniref:peptidoglycan-binding protein n=1 Tax=Frigidibacter sp. MR17.14 TaxID=3126509 RepID=UPI003012BBE7